MCQNTEGSAKFIYGWLDKYYDGENWQERTSERENKRQKSITERGEVGKHSEKAMAPTPVLSPGNSHGRRSLVGCSPWGRLESDTTERLPFHFSLSCIGEGNGTPLQCSWLENPREGGAWWAAVYGVAQSQTRLKRLSSSSSSIVWVRNYA